MLHRWTHKTDPDVYSFAAVTDDPPPEVAATGHNRCIIAIKPENVVAAGWAVEDFPRNCSLFCELENERVCVSIECFEPGAGGLPGWPNRR